jgi:3-dehydroquinate dehydratase-2
MAKKTSKSKPLPIHILNGPNLNLLGSREPAVYGTATLADVEKACAQRAKAHGFAIRFKQTNKEGELVELIQDARHKAAALLINAAAYTHTSVAVLDALKVLEIPVMEVHLSNPARREDFRHKSYVAMGATGTITGLGLNSYLLAIDAVATLLQEKSIIKGKTK